MFRGKHITEWIGTGVLMLACAIPSFARQPHQAAPQNRPASRPPSAPASRPPGPPAYRAPNRPYSRPGPHSGQWLRQYRALPPEQQRRALENDPQFRRLAPERQQQLQQRLQRFNARPPEQQQRVLNRMETWEHLTPQQKDTARHLYSQWKDLPPDRRQPMQNAIQALRGMPPDARQREIESGRFSQYSPQERDILRGVSQLPLAPPEPAVNNVPRPPQ